MWPPWGKLKLLLGKAATSSSPSPSILQSKYSSSFSSSSLKNVHSLFNEEPDPAFCSSSCSGPPRKSVVLNRLRSASSALLSWKSLPEDSFRLASGEEKRIVLYYTSLRVVRKTFEDCRAVRSILRGFCVAVDERDLFMDAGFLGELKGILGGRVRGQQLGLPQVFIGGRYIGGAEEIRQLHESGELKQYVKGVAPVTVEDCEECGGFRFVLCGLCRGSHKRFEEKGGRGFRSCPACNENGLVHCPICFDASAAV